MSRTCPIARNVIVAPLVALLVMVGVVLVGLTPAAAAVGTVTLTAVADTYVDSSASGKDTNYGSATVVQASQNTHRVFMRFDGAQVPAGATVTKATLRVYSNSSQKGSLVVHPLTDLWVESTATSSNSPTWNPSQLATSTKLTNKAYATAALPASTVAVGRTFSVGLSTSAALQASLASRETANRPQLVVEYLITAAPSLSPTASPTVSPTPSPTASPTVSPTPSPTASPTVSPTPSPTAPGDTGIISSAGKLSWAPPALTNPVTYRVSGEGPGTIIAPAGQDSIVVFDGPVNRRIRMDGGRHWVVRGGEVDNNREWTNIEEQSGLQFQNVTGTAFVEGMLIHGRYGKDGIRIGTGGSSTTLIVQNTRILERMSGPTVYHADVIQAFGGVKSLKVDGLTGSGDYQGQMWKQEAGTTFGPSDFRRVNYRAATPQVQYLINFVMSAPTQPVTLSEVYSQSDPGFMYGDFCRTAVPAAGATCSSDAQGRKYLTWSGTPITVNGRVTQGPPPAGDFVPAGAAGLGYVTPGYL